MGVKMNIETYYKKIYAVAFRLTGNETMACKFSTQAILKTFNTLDINNQVTNYIFKLTALEVCKIFLEENNTYYFDVNYATENNKSNDKIQALKEALLILKPLNRITVIWKDVLGFQLSDIIQLTNINKEGLNEVLALGRRQIKEYLIKNCIEI